MNFQAILGWAVIIGLLWFMTRRGAQGGGGCCGGHGGQEPKRHEAHDGHQAVGAGETAVDPVCGMTVRKDKALHATVDGQDYYFCNEACRKEFTEGRQGDGAHAGHH